MNHQQPLISVIIPVYNVKKYLYECVNSVRMQSYKNLEIILIDDESTDGSGELCEQFQNEDSRIKVLHQCQQGPGPARNTGIAASTGDYIAFVDSDDQITLNMYETLINLLFKYNADMASCTHTYMTNIDSNRLYTGETILFNNQQFMEQYILNSSKYHKNITAAVWQRLYKKSIISNIKFSSSKRGEDLIWSAKAIDKCDKIIYVDKPLYLYRLRNDSICGKIISKYITESIITELLAETKKLKLFLDETGYTDLAAYMTTKYYAFALNCWCRVKNDHSPETMIYEKNLYTELYTTKFDKKYANQFSLSHRLGLFLSLYSKHAYYFIWRIINPFRNLK